MSGTTTKHDIELIIEKVSGGSGGPRPPAESGGDGDRGRGGSERSLSRRYRLGLTIGIVAILMFFMSLASAYLVRKGLSRDWQQLRLPEVVWINTVVLLLSSVTLELARKRLAASDAGGFKKLWWLSVTLGFAFLFGQFEAWQSLAAQGVYLATNPASSFFYLFMGAHALHLLGGLIALLYVGLRNFEHANVTRAVAAELASYYWHFMDALWIFLLAVLFLSRY